MKDADNNLRDLDNFLDDEAKKVKFQALDEEAAQTIILIMKDPTNTTLQEKINRLRSEANELFS